MVLLWSPLGVLRPSAGLRTSPLARRIAVPGPLEVSARRRMLGVRIKFVFDASSPGWALPSALRPSKPCNQVRVMAIAVSLAVTLE
jgi:hypothetical protein